MAALRPRMCQRRVWFVARLALLSPNLCVVLLVFLEDAVDQVLIHGFE
jgi:hypothetical protein